MKKRTSIKKAASKKATPKSTTGADKARTQASLFSDILAAHQLRQSEFLQHVQDGHRFAHIGRKRPFCFILGAGASFQSGIPTAGTLVDEWLRDIYSRASSPLRLEDWATAENLEITGFSYAHRNEYYSAIFDLRFRGHEEDGTLFLQEKMKGVQPSYGYAVLAQLLGDVHNVVITTNFDSLASDAMFLFGGEAPFICGHERMADYIPEHSNRPVIVKIHRDLLTGPINSRKGTAHLNDAWHEPVKRLLQRYIPIFIGYGGNDGSLMQFLSDLPEDTPERVYWCHYKHDTLSSQVVTYLNGKNRYLVPIDGFDQLMQSIHGVLGLPDLLEMLERKNNDRLTSLRASQAKLTATAQADVVDAEKSDGKNSPDALTARFNYAKALYDQGRFAEAEQECREVFQLREQVLGAEHPDTLSSRNSLGIALRALGNYAEAEQQHRAALKIRERVLGVEHPDTLSSRNNLAVVLAGQGRHAEAELEHRAVLQIRERVLGAEHPNTLSSRGNLALALDLQGKHAEALLENQTVVKIKDRVFGAEHPNTLTSRMNLANALHSLGRHTQAEKEHRIVTQARERVLGAEHPDVAQSCYNLVLCLKAQQKLPDALAFIQRAEYIWSKVLGPHHQDTKDATALRQRIEGALNQPPPQQ